VAIAVAKSDEERREGSIAGWKARPAGAGHGADVVIGEYRRHEWLCASAYLLPSDGGIKSSSTLGGSRPVFSSRRSNLPRPS